MVASLGVGTAPAAALNERIFRCMADDAPLSLLYCDPRELRVMYANKAALCTLSTAGHALPVPGQAVVGRGIEFLFASREDMLRVVGDPRNLPCQRQARMGEQVYDVTIMAVTDFDGSYLGLVVSWWCPRKEAKPAADVIAVVDGVTSAASRMRETAQAMAALAEQTRNQAAAVAAAAMQASGNVQSVSVSAEELTASITEIGRQVSHSTRRADAGVAEARKANETVQSLSQAARKIGDVVKLINTIASQTNLLALNATIEAARAGEAGRGFAVVAGEVKALANQTAKATDDIAQQVAAIQQSTAQATAAMQAVSGTILEISEVASSVSAAVNQQGVATKMISQNVQEAAAGTREVSQIIGGVTRASDEAGQSANKLLGVAADMSRQAEELRSQVNAFFAQHHSS